MADNEARFEYQEASLKDVLRHYTKDFESKEFTILSTEWFVDPMKKKVIFKFLVKDKGSE